MSELIHLHPLVFTLQDVITGCGFLAGIVVTGKAVMEREEDGKWWMYGVCPGALAGSGNTPNEAFVDFRNRYKETLFDMAEDCKSFLVFRRAVQEFFTEDKAEGVRWDDALQFLRQHEDGITEPFNTLPRKRPDEFHLGIRIDRLERMKESKLKPANNIQDSLAKVA